MQKLWSVFAQARIWNDILFACLLFPVQSTWFSISEVASSQYSYSMKWVVWSVIMAHCGLMAPYVRCHETWSTLVQVVACHLIGAKLVPEPLPILSVIGTQGRNFNEILIKIRTFCVKLMHLKMLSSKCRPFRSGAHFINNFLGRNSNLMETSPLAAQLSCHVQNFVTITVLESRWEWNEISIEFKLRWKNC